MSKEAMKLALEALESCDFTYTFGNGGYQQFDRPSVEKAIAALREALAEQPAQQEPVGRLESDPDEGHVFVPRIDGDWSMLGKDLYTSPPAQCKPLTDEQIAAIGKELGLKCRLGGNPNIDFDYARAIEAAHGIKEKPNEQAN